MHNPTTGEYKAFNVTQNNATGENEYEEIALPEGDKDTAAKFKATLNPESVLNTGTNAQQEVANSIKELPLFQRAMLRAGQETTGLVEGAAALGLDTGAVIANAWENEHPSIVPPGTAYKLYNKAEGIRKAHSADKEAGDILRANAGFGADLLGGSLPYYVSGYALGPAFRKLGSKFMEGITGLAEGADAEAKTLTRNTIDKLKETPLSPLANRIDRELVAPAEERAAQVAKRPPWRSPYREGAMSDILGSAGLGAVEGGVNLDSDVKSGAISGLYGGILGRLLKYRVERSPLEPDPAYNQALKDLQDIGYRTKPGQDLDNKMLQQREHAYGSHDAFSGMQTEFDKANQIALNRHAYAQMGLDADYAPPDVLRAHVNKIGRDYNKLTSQISAKITPVQMADLRRHALSLTNSITDEDIKASKYAEKYIKKFDEFRKQQVTSRNPINGRIQAAVQPGNEWQNLYRDLHSDMSNLRNSGQHDVVKALQPFAQALDSAAETGVSRLGRTPEEAANLVRQFKDLNTKTAMSKILLKEGGLDAFGNVSPVGLHNYFVRNMPEEYRMNGVTRNGNTIPSSELMKIGKEAAIDKRQAGSSMSGLNMAEVSPTAKLTERQAFMATPALLMPGMAREALFNYYMRAKPAVHGIVPDINIGPIYLKGAYGPKGFGNTVLHTRALEQGTQTHADAYKKFETLRTKIEDLLGD